MRCLIAIFAGMLLLVTTESRAQQLRRKSDQRSKPNKYQKDRTKPRQTKAKAKKVYHIPFNSHGNTIRMEIANGTSGPAKKLKLTVQDIPGWMQLTPASLSVGNLAAGLQELRWDASRYASGLYFYRIIAGGPGQQKIVRNKKMMLVK